MSIRHIAVVVPAADEEDHITGCLDSIAAARLVLHAARPDIGSSLVAVLDRCTDATASLVSAAGVPAVTSSARRVGAARGVGASAVLAGLAIESSAVWLANTDADSRVPDTWLLDHVSLADEGAGLLLGTVVPDDSPVLDRWQELHDASDGHRHVHGANLGVRADVLATVGGWPALQSGEDVALVRTVTAAGVPVTRTARSPVRTSHRVVGRAPGGFAEYLATLEW